MTPDRETLAEAAGVLNDTERVTILGGAGCESCHDEVMALAGREKPDGGFADRLTQHYRRVRAHLDAPAEARPHDAPMRPQHVAAAVDRPAEGDTIFAADVGTPTVWAARHLTMNGHRRLIGSFNQASWPTRCRRPSAGRRPRAGDGRWWHRAGTAGSAYCWAT